MRLGFITGCNEIALMNPYQGSTFRLMFSHLEVTRDHVLLAKVFCCLKRGQGKLRAKDDCVTLRSFN